MKEERDLKLRLFVESALSEHQRICDRMSNIIIEIEKLTQEKSDLALKKMDAEERIKKAEREYAKFKETKHE